MNPARREPAGVLCFYPFVIGLALDLESDARESPRSIRRSKIRSRARSEMPADSLSDLDLLVIARDPLIYLSNGFLPSGNAA